MARMAYTPRSPPYRATSRSTAYFRTPCGLIKKSKAIICVSIIIVVAIILAIFIYQKAGSKSSSFLNRVYKEPSAKELAYRRAFVRNMTASAFGAYQKYAWGQPELRPVTQRPFINGSYHLPGLTILASMSTLWVMGLEKEWAAGREWISDKLLPSLQGHQGRLDTSETIRSGIGGLLSAYALSGDKMFLDNALKVYQNMPEDLFQVFKAGYLPQYYAPANLSKVSSQKGNYSQKEVIIDFQLPELIYLGNLTSTSSQGDEISEWLAEARSSVVYSDGSSVKGFHTHLARPGSDEPARYTWLEIDFAFYQNMIRSYEQLGRWDSRLLAKFGEAVKSAGKMGQFAVVRANGHEENEEDEERPTLKEDDLLYIRDFNYEERHFQNLMYSRSCRLGGLFALSAVNHFREDLFEKHLRAIVLGSRANSASGQERESRWFQQGKVHLAFAHWITETCYREASTTQTKLLPFAYFRDKVYSTHVKVDSSLAETYFFLYRLTHNERYREWAWELAQAIQQHAKVAESGGFSDLKTVNSVPPTFSDHQPAQFFSSTLKFLYLTFADEEDVLPLEKWVFNLRGHPLPICGKSERYTDAMCQ